MFVDVEEAKGSKVRSGELSVVGDGHPGGFEDHQTEYQLVVAVMQLFRYITLVRLVASDRYYCCAADEIFDEGRRFLKFYFVGFQTKSSKVKKKEKVAQQHGWHNLLSILRWWS